MRVARRQRRRPRCGGGRGKLRTDWAGKKVFVTIQYELKLETVLFMKKKKKKEVLQILLQASSLTKIHLNKTTYSTSETRSTGVDEEGKRLRLGVDIIRALLRYKRMQSPIHCKTLTHIFIFSVS